MCEAKDIAEQATMQSFLNCYLKETGNGRLIEDTQETTEVEFHLLKQMNVQRFIRTQLNEQGIKLIIPVRYGSATGRHLFAFPIYYTTNNRLIELDYVTMAALLVKELSIFNRRKVNLDELMLRIMLSHQNTTRYVKARSNEKDKLFSYNTTFIEAEQSLIFGHMLHPTPKSRQGIAEEDESIYAPELEGAFQLHYFRAHCSIVRESSSLSKNTTSLIKGEMLNDPDVDDDFKEKFCQDDNYSLIPIHPLQADFLLKKNKVSQLIQKGLLAYLGPQGKRFAPTSSVRTVYHETSSFMYKFSLNVKITNSLRVNKLKELERGVEVHRLLSSEIGKELSHRFPGFHIIRDPAYITLNGGLEELGFEVVLRENPFQREQAENAILLAGLCQDNLFGGQSRLAALINHLAEKEKRSVEEVSMDWFRRYLQVSVQPMMWLYFTYGIAIEAHQQNTVIQLKEGYPSRFYFRDNQGYYFCQSTAGQLKEIFPELNAKSDTICGDEVADERLRYYFFFNNIFGLINAFGVSGLADETKLLSVLRGMLERLKHRERTPSQLLTSLLEEERLSCKGNLMTRFYDMDELTGSMETQSVYVNVDNPLKREVPVSHER